MRPLKFVLIVCLFLQQAALAPQPAQAGADPKARALAERVLQQMGGAEGWEATRFISWAFIGQYQIWDKQQQQFRWEKDSLVAVLDIRARTGKVYERGQALQDEQKVRDLLDHAYAQWTYNSFWLLMPFRLLDKETDLAYAGEGKTQTGAPADMLEVTFPEEGAGKYLVWVDKAEGLVTQWAFFSDSTSATPVFIRRWSDYGDYGSIKLAADRSSLQSDLRLHRIAVPAHVPDTIFNSPMPVAKSSKSGF
ncbi:hypothetical protein [Botryobacter ruber]|uniref:hypothetical protein n=1 Tax=Botryobacter ruber TaxID=2171629 RepID=UPI000F64BB72|nr:hypothetical protein [Botryobacter ruber]